MKQKRPKVRNTRFVFTPTAVLTPGSYTVSVSGVTIDTPLFQPGEGIVEVQ